jgi:hypothetical protein
LIVFDTSTVVSAELKADSIPERALLRVEEVDVLALSAAEPVGRKSGAHSANADGGLRFAHPPYGVTMDAIQKKEIRE